MSDDDNRTSSQQADWLKYWSTAMADWQRTYASAMEGFAQRAEQMTGMRGAPGFVPEDLMRMWSRLFETWTAGMSAMPSGMGAAGTPQQQIAACAAQAYFATTANMMRWWMRVAQSWGEYGRNAAARSASGMQDPATLGILADETRAQMRKIVDISFEECSLLQRQMEELGEKVRSLVGGAMSDFDPRRWAKTKE